MIDLKKAIVVGLLAVAMTCQLHAETEKTNPEPFTLRVLTYNIHHGEGNDKKFDLPRIAKVIQNTKPDLVALQEVDRETTRAMGVDQARELGKLTGMKHVFGAAMKYAGGEYGEAILHNQKIATATNHHLKAPEGYEPRAAIAIRFQPKANLPTINFIGTHLDHASKDVRLQQAKKLIKITSKPEYNNTILAGDLNATPNSAVIKELETQYTNATKDKTKPTYPSTKPTRQIDYILMKSNKKIGQWKVKEIRVIDEKVASDHAPLLVVLEWIPARVETE